MPDALSDQSESPGRWRASRITETTHGGQRFDVTEDVAALANERDHLRALLKQAHDRHKFQGQFPTIQWYDEVARYFEGKVPERAFDEEQP